MSESEIETLQRSSREPASLREPLQRWLASRLPPGAEPLVAALSSPSATGMSSETLLFDAEWEEHGERRRRPLAARLEPAPSDVPVFPVYDLEGQYRVLELLAERTDVPVPRVYWLELDRAPLGARFFVMDRVDGRVPPDVMPYTFGSWLSEASEAERRRLQDSTVAVLAAIHATDLRGIDTRFLAAAAPGATPLERHFEAQRRYYDWCREGRHHPVIERTFRWLEGHWPAVESPAVLCWGDARIGNVLYRGFEPAAVLDWEMASLGPRELDLGWFLFMHVFFDDLARQAGLPGMPDFLRREDVVRAYRERSGHEPRDLPFFEVYAALRHAIIMTRVHARRVRFGEAEWPADPDEVIPHRGWLERRLEAR